MTNSGKIKEDRTLDEIFVEADLFGVMETLTSFERHIMREFPQDLLLLPSGEANIRNRWGAVLHHVRMTRATLRAFL